MGGADQRVFSTEHKEDEVRKMALQQFVCGFTLMTILLCRGCHAQQPACGRPVINSRIIGGENAAPGRWPWFAAIRYDGRDICGGSLINNQWVLTAADCIYYGYLNGAVVHLGVHNRSDTSPNEVSRGVEAVVCHPEFSTRTLDNDVCLLKMSAPVNFTDYIQPVCLASANSTFHDGITGWITGFGFTGSSYYYYYNQPDILQEARVPIVGNNRCNCTFNSYYSLTENMMCAGFEDGRNRTTWGDTGVPLVIKKGSIWLQTGIQSYLSFYHYSSGFSVFTQVSRYEKWINDRISDMEPGFFTFTSPGIDSDLNYTCPTQSSTTTSFYAFTASTAVYTTDKDDSVFSGACGRPLINSRIIGGENAAPGRWPWFAAIRYDGRDICGGSLINNQWVLTSAYCIYVHYISATDVHLGVYLGVHSQSNPSPNEVSRGVEAILYHPEFSTQTYDNDICLLKLSAPVSFTDYIQPVCLASANSTFHDGITSWVTGFGYTGSYYYFYDEPDILQEARVPIVGNNRCNCAFNSYYSLTENMMCAGFEDGRNWTTWGDSGAPLVIKKGSIWLQTGIQSEISFYSSRFSVFTRVSRYERWINDTMSGMKPGFVTFTSPGIDKDLNYICPTTFSGSENLIHFTHLVSLFSLALFFHIFVGSG